MEDSDTSSTAGKKHSLPTEAITPASGADGDRDVLTRRRGQGIGLRVHGIYFIAVSLAALVALITLIAIASSMMK
ncbi:MAG: hypothetical protein M3Y66_03320 [Actinomycetota bacterium]|nr:hypothetical protein [Actinomycetota bacterium]